MIHHSINYNKKIQVSLKLTQDPEKYVSDGSDNKLQLVQIKQCFHFHLMLFSVIFKLEGFRKKLIHFSNITFPIGMVITNSNIEIVIMSVKCDLFIKSIISVTVSKYEDIIKTVT